MKKAGVNFTNILQAAFTHADPKSLLNHQPFCVFGSALVKAVCKHVDDIDHWCQLFVLCANGLVKLTLGVDFTNILRTAFTFEDPNSAKKTDRLTVYFVLWVSGCIKAAHKMLVK